MNPNDNTDPDREVSLNCPKCGAPAAPPALDELMVTCIFCNQSFTIPRAIRQAQERRLFQLRGLGVPSSSNNKLLVPILIGTTLFVVLIYAMVAYRMNQGSPAGTHAASQRVTPPDSVPSNPQEVVVPQEIVVDRSRPEGGVWVKERLAYHEGNGCNAVLLPATRIVGGRDIDAKLIANGPCVRLLASSGTSGDTLELTMRTPKGAAVTTPPAATELDFLYCPKQAGLHPATIRSSGEHPFTVSSIECSWSRTKVAH